MTPQAVLRASKMAIRNLMCNLAAEGGFSLDAWLCAESDSSDEFQLLGYGLVFLMERAWLFDGFRQGGAS